MSDERDDMLMQLFSKEATDDTDAHFVERICEKLLGERRRRKIVRVTLAIVATMIAFVIALMNLDGVSAFGNAILDFATELSQYPLVVVLFVVLALPVIGIVRR